MGVGSTGWRLMLALCLLGTAGTGQQSSPQLGWAGSCWAGGRLVRFAAPAASLDVRAEQPAREGLAAGAFGASFSAELPLTPGQALRLELRASGGSASLAVRVDGQHELASARSVEGRPASTGWFTPETDRVVLEVLFQGDGRAARLSLALEPEDATPGLAGCRVPEVFRNELDPLAEDDAESPRVGPEPPRVFFLTQSAGYRHAVVTREQPDRLSLAERALLAEAGERYRIRCSQDARELPALLNDLDAVIFYTTGELPLDAGQRQALLDWVANGGAFVGLHSATDSLYATPAYLAMLGGRFDGHPWHQAVRLRVEQPAHPAVRALGESWSLTDEIYQFRDFRRFPNSVLLSLDNRSMDVSKGHRSDGDYASCWCKAYGRGRVFYTALGHRAELWSDPRYLQHVLGGLEWALHGPDLPVPAPAGATRLIAASPGLEDLDPSAWRQRDGAPCRFQWAGAGLVLDSSDLVSRRAFGDALIHGEFLVPEEAPAGGPAVIYVAGVHGLQLSAVGGGGDPAPSGPGAVPGLAAAARDAARPGGSWQSFEIRYRAGRLDEAGRGSETARLSAWLNGLQVQDELTLTGVTPGGLGRVDRPVGPVLLHDGGAGLRYRNLWVLPGAR